ncbi:MAG: hypothetical protein CMJ20_11035 [Phycisphaeraceae bacterium]|nr:hypothetical protein [Phycisphaeraceae bacterium]
MTVWFWLVLVTAYGACVGSFLNVLIYRLPRDLDIATSPSSCPKCGHRLTWYDNVPVFGWIWLRGRCRYCSNVINIEYPVIETLTATLFGGLFAIYYMTDLPNGHLPNGQWLSMGLMVTWPVLVVHLVLLGSLIVASVIDFKFFVIPLSIPRVVTLFALLELPLAVLWFAGIAAEELTPNSNFVGTALGGGMGLLVANGLLATGLLPRSFDTPPENQAPMTSHETSTTPQDVQQWHVWHGLTRECLFAIGLVVLTGGLWGFQVVMGTAPFLPEAMGVELPVHNILMVIATVVLAILLSGVIWSRRQPISPEAASQPPPAEWPIWPHPRREVLKECLFLLWPLVGAWVGWMSLDDHGAASGQCRGGIAAPLAVLTGCLLGYFVGAAVVWVTRIVGTLVFGREAMGLGDVHLLGAIGAVLGWQDVLLVFFIAPFFGLISALLLAGIGKLVRGQVRMIPYGPYLAIATIVVMVVGGHSILEKFGILGGVGVVAG